MTTQTLLLASRNPGKLLEFQELLPGFELVPWPMEAPDIPEDGAFFHENARQKAEFARWWWQKHGTRPVSAALADDSGLCVDALWGGPGVLSARFARGVPQALKNRRLLEMLPREAPRTARFVCVLALAPLEGETRCFSGSVEGSLAPEPRGAGGFGFDPIFIPEGHEATFGQLPATVKQTLSHRARATQALLAALAGERT